jgi:pyridoxine/pyridoxamine 5'-phosphate oxidase
MTRGELLKLMRGAREWVVATEHADGSPQAAVVGVAVTDRLELVFDTLGDTRKCSNLRRDPRVALVMWAGDRTVQVEGLADEPQGEERQRVRAAYYARFPDGPEREGWDGITWVRVRPQWVRCTDFSGPDPEITEFPTV